MIEVPEPQPLVSIVLPTYNRACWLDGAIASCLDQTWSNLELVVVDDGSTDSTPEVIASWSGRDGRVRCVRQQNARLPRALNAGFAAARGELLTWTSDDNLYEREAIGSMARYLVEHPAVGLVYCGTKVIDDEGSLFGTLPRDGPEFLAERNVVGACFMYTRAVAARVGEYDPKLYLAEDYDYWLRISRVAPVALLEGVTPYRFRIHGESLTSTREAEAHIVAGRARAKSASTRAERRRALGQGFARASEAYRAHRDFVRATRMSCRAIAACPWDGAAYRGLAASLLRHVPRLPDTVRQRVG